jgi:nitrate reductase molybdenum cofactor assembly chaperone NarJ/NarW
MKTFRALSALLQYPTERLVDALDEIADVIDREAVAPRSIRPQLTRLFDRLRDGDLYDLQEEYVILFDRTRSLSLHIFEHIHGESRDRGQALVDLKSVYEARGLMVDTKELPDYLPLFLEFLSLLPSADARALLAEPAHVFTALAERLAKRQSPYEAILRTLLAIAEAKPDTQALEALREEADPAPDDLAALDAAWEEEAVSFGPGQSGCKDDLAAKIRQGRRPAPGVEDQIRAAHETTASARQS